MQQYTPTPDMYDYICHYGVKGMKWRKGRKTPIRTETERERLNRLNPASSRAGNITNLLKLKNSKPVTTDESSDKKATSSSSSSSKKKGKGGSKKAVKDLLDRFKLTKGSSKSSSDKKTGSTRGTSEKKESSSSRSSSSSTTKKESSTSSRVEEKKTEEVKLTDEQKKKMEETATKNQALLDSKRAKISAQELDLAKKRKKGDVKKWVRSNSGTRKLYPRS